MVTVISPAKSLDWSPVPTGVPEPTDPRYPAQTAELIRTVRRLKVEELAALMELSEKLAALNHQRFKDWARVATDENSRPAILAFDGDVYQGIDRGAWKSADFDQAQKSLRILSGLYGVLRPLDRLQPYRLEMGRPLVTKAGVGLYRFWGELITHSLQEDVEATQSPCVVNLASEEYFAAVRPASLAVPVVNCVFKDFSGGKFKIVSFFAKKARGLMADFIVRERLTRPEQMRDFCRDGYRLDEAASTHRTLTFVRQKASA
jgi:uncharacterized protein